LTLGIRRCPRGGRRGVHRRKRNGGRPIAEEARPRKEIEGRRSPGRPCEEGWRRHEWFSDPDVKKQIAGLLREFNLDETAIEAEAFRKSADDLERIDRLMASAEARRDKALVCIAQYRGDFGVLLRESSDRLVDGKVLKLEHAGSKERKPAA
jgi:hypothetical protein